MFSKEVVNSPSVKEQKPRLDGSLYNWSSGRSPRQGIASRIYLMSLPNYLMSLWFCDLSIGVRLGEVELFSLERRRLKRELINTCKQLKGRCKNGVKLFSLASSDRTKNNGKKGTQEDLYEYQKTALFTVTEYWRSLPRNDCRIFILKILKRYLDMVLGNLLSIALLEQGGWPRSNLDHAVILWYFIHSTHEFVFYPLTRQSGIDNHLPLFLYISVMTSRNHNIPKWFRKE